MPAEDRWVDNVPLVPYGSEREFWDIYERRYTRILRSARTFLQRTDAKTSEAVVFLRCAFLLLLPPLFFNCCLLTKWMCSCGFGASTFESDGVAGTCRVPPSFFYRFTRDACALADTYAEGRLVSVLEGGYSDRAI